MLIWFWFGSDLVLIWFWFGSVRRDMMSVSVLSLSLASSCVISMFGLHVYIYIYICIYTYTYICIHICMCIYIYIYLYIYIYVIVCMYMHIYIYIYMHIYIYSLLYRARDSGISYSARPPINLGRAQRCNHGCFAAWPLASLATPRSDLVARRGVWRGKSFWIIPVSVKKTLLRRIILSGR